jgi:ABC-type sugar transport system ATPase subunit
MASISIDGLHKSFGPTQILRGISTHMAEGAFTVIVGPSGCGKSTLLRLVAGLESPDSGHIHIGGQDVTHQPPGARNVAMVFQAYALFPHLTVADNIGFGLSIRGVKKSDIARRVAEAAEVLQLTPVLNRKPRQLSGGQRQRVAMGRALVRDAQVFLYDEPLSNLDASLRVAMRTEVKRLHRSIGTTSLYVTHDQAEAMTLADRLIVMRNGVIAQEGPPLDLYANPASMFVAGFLGALPMNFLAGERKGDEIVVPGVFSVPAQGASVQSVSVGLRPEDLQPCPNDAAAFFLRTTLVEPLGAETVVHGDVGGQTLIAKLPGNSNPAVGDLLPLRPTAAAMHLFDTATGTRLSGGL